MSKSEQDIVFKSFGFNTCSESCEPVDMLDTGKFLEVYEELLDIDTVEERGDFDRLVKLAVLRSVRLIISYELQRLGKLLDECPVEVPSHIQETIDIARKEEYGDSNSLMEELLHQFELEKNDNVKRVKLKSLVQDYMKDQLDYYEIVKHIAGIIKHKKVTLDTRKIINMNDLVTYLVEVKDAGSWILDSTTNRGFDEQLRVLQRFEEETGAQLLSQLLSSEFTSNKELWRLVREQNGGLCFRLVLTIDDIHLRSVLLDKMVEDCIGTERPENITIFCAWVYPLLLTYVQTIYSVFELKDMRGALEVSNKAGNYGSDIESILTSLIDLIGYNKAKYDALLSMEDDIISQYRDSLKRPLSYQLRSANQFQPGYFDELMRGFDSVMSIIRSEMTDKTRLKSLLMKDCFAFFKSFMANDMNGEWKKILPSFNVIFEVFLGNRMLGEKTPFERTVLLRDLDYFHDIIVYSQSIAELIYDDRLKKEIDDFLRGMEDCYEAYKII